MHVQLDDADWDGVRVPESARCGPPDGSGSACSPALRVSDLPPGTDALLLAFNDLDWPPLATDGGHGVLRVAVPAGAQTVAVPRVRELRDTALPPGVTVAAHNRGRAPIGYRAPCGGGDVAHRYEVIVSALIGDRVVSTSHLSLGRLDGEPAWVAKLS